MKLTNQICAHIVAGTLLFLIGSLAAGQNSTFHNAPANTKLEKTLPGPNVSSGNGSISTTLRGLPRTDRRGLWEHSLFGVRKGASDGEIFWYITKGDVNNGMPSWASLPEEERWQIINYLRVLGASKPGSPRVRLSADEIAQQVVC